MRCACCNVANLIISGSAQVGKPSQFLVVCSPCVHVHISSAWHEWVDSTCRCSYSSKVCRALKGSGSVYVRNSIGGHTVCHPVNCYSVLGFWCGTSRSMKLLEQRITAQCFDTVWEKKSGEKHARCGSSQPSVSSTGVTLRCPWEMVEKLNVSGSREKSQCQHGLVGYVGIYRNGGYLYTKRRGLGLNNCPEYWRHRKWHIRQYDTSHHSIECNLPRRVVDANALALE